LFIKGFVWTISASSISLFLSESIAIIVVLISPLVYVIGTFSL